MPGFTRHCGTLQAGSGAQAFPVGQSLSRPPLLASRGSAEHCPRPGIHVLATNQALRPPPRRKEGSVRLVFTKDTAINVVTEVVEQHCQRVKK